MSDPNDGAVWDKDHKIWDVDMPFHRINSPFYDPAKNRPNGLGFPCGCSQAFKGPGQLLRMVPSWVDVVKEPGGPEREVEGTLVRSFQTWTDVPLLQWHRWYDWNFHVSPSD